ncbi:MBL fold metallo-hydrolase [Frigidibacter sp. ROC022]|uniref:MBL fold metallo-hydrolase n=1 Tax=Frigidibacter sp. ROC022 TaxID=2971796 RepID=UPI00215A659F|nr:MBL fold metallo-hydrolase [Frigidibacter sp. ROC022]MCR8724538.1 MBL fold metallo-hydrolase [Frigidibacter sp. ROC022]
MERQFDNPGFYSRRLGDFFLTALHDGHVIRDRPAGFIRGVDEAVVEAAFTEVGNSPGKLEVSFNPLLVDTGALRVLIDTGHGPNGPPGTGRTIANLTAREYSPKEIDVVLISHFHGDHINGLLDAEEKPAFPNARIIIPAPERDFWLSDRHSDDEFPGRMKVNRQAAQRIFAALGERVETVDWCQEIVPGITAIESAGHSPGHTSYRITSEGAALLFAGDVTNNPGIFARYPDWIATFDNWPQKTAQTRHRILRELAETGTPAYFFHAPFPCFGRITASETGFDFRHEIWRQD